MLKIPFHGEGRRKESNLAEMNRLYLDLQKNQNTLNDKIRESQALQIDKANLAMELEAQKKTLEKAKELVSKCSRDSKGAQAELVDLMRQVEVKKEERGSIVIQRDGIIERSRVRAQELEKLSKSFDHYLKFTDFMFKFLSIFGFFHYILRSFLFAGEPAFLLGKFML